MVKCPCFEDYDINALVLLGNRTNEILTRNQIKMSIVNKLFNLGKPMFFLINMFIKSDNILKEAYADTIMMYMKGYNYYIDGDIITEILKYASLDALMYYGADSDSIEFSNRCKEEFDNRAKLIEDKMELNKKRKRRKLKRKGD